MSDESPFTLGYRAYQEGKAQESNPYDPRDRKHDYWLNGWDEAAEEDPNIIGDWP